MHRLRPIIALPLAVAALAGAFAIPALRDALPAWFMPYDGIANIALMLIALFVAARIGLTPDPKPNLSLDEAVTLLSGVSHRDKEGTSAEDIARKLNRTHDALIALTQEAAVDRIAVWGANVPFPAFGVIRSALTKIPPDYWRHHKIEVLEFFKGHYARTVTLSDEDRDSYSDLRFDRDEIKRFKKRGLELSANPSA